MRRIPVLCRCACALLVAAWCLSTTVWAQNAPAPPESQPAASNSQWTPPTPFQGGVGFIGASPLGAFATSVPDGAGGFLFNLDRSLAHSVFSVGGELGWMVYGDKSRDVSLASLIPEVPDAKVTVDTTNAIVLLLGRVRIQPQHGIWRPYVDGVFGFTDIYTDSTVEGGVVCADIQRGCVTATLASQTQSRDFSLSYGWGAGVMIAFSARERAPRLDVSVQNLSGGRATYLTEDALHQEGDQLRLDFTRSRTDMITVYIGVAFGR